jgi:hypothetical protein
MPPWYHRKGLGEAQLPPPLCVDLGRGWEEAYGFFILQ